MVKVLRFEVTSLFDFGRITTEILEACEEQSPVCISVIAEIPEYEPAKKGVE